MGPRWGRWTRGCFQDGASSALPTGSSGRGHGQPARRGARCGVRGVTWGERRARARRRHRFGVARRGGRFCRKEAGGGEA